MSLRLQATFAALAALGFVSAAPAHAAVVVDGKLDAAYGSPVATQTTQTSFGDNNAGLVNYANGSELDEAYAFIDAGGVLHVFLSGNLASRLVPSDSQDASDQLFLFFDSVPGGQNVVIDPADVNLDGATFDPGFEADYALGAINRDVQQFPVNPFQVTFSTLPTGTAMTTTFLGATTPGGPGTLTGGTNPDNIEGTIDCSNVAGVTAGCGAASGAGVTTGVEFAVPLAALGSPTGCIRILAVVTDLVGFSTSNQSLPPMPVGTCTQGRLGTVNFAAMAGDQFFTVCPGATPAPPSSWGRMKASYR